jgi:hypothetical protein
MLDKIVIGIVILSVCVAAALAVWVCYPFGEGDLQTNRVKIAPTGTPTDPTPEGCERATLGGGCFWCTEAFFQRLKGVRSVVSGFSGGSVADPTYEQVCSGRTGHAEAIQIVYDPNEITYAELLEVF